MRLIGLMFVGAVIGVMFWGGFNWTVEMTNTETFCISCHEMKDNVYEEYTETIHYYNRSGVRAVCTDCHVPKEWTHKMVRKIQASNELLHKVLGTIDTREKFKEHRLVLAQREWKRFSANGSKECRACHDYKDMDFEKMRPASQVAMRKAAERNQSCVDCHKGVAHRLPNVEQSIGAEKGGATQEIFHPAPLVPEK